MSTIKVNNLQNASGGSNSTPEEIEQGRAKAWVNFNGTGTVAIREDFNISSITDQGTGKYRVNFDTAMPDVNYVAGGSSTLNNTGNNWRIPTQTRPWTASYSLWQCILSTNGANEDHEFVTLSFFR